MKNSRITIAALAFGVLCLFGCQKYHVYPDAHLGAPYLAPVDVCDGDWSFSADATTFDFVSVACDVLLKNATVKLAVESNGQTLIVQASDYPTRAATQTSNGWLWSLSGLATAPDIAIAVSLNSEQNAATLSATLSVPAGGSAWTVDWFELPSTEADQAGVTLPGASGDAGWLQNGHDSWTFTGVEKMKNIEQPPQWVNGAPFPCADDYRYLSTCPGVSWWFGALGPSDRTGGLLWGALSAQYWKTYGASWYPQLNQALHFDVVQGTPGDARALAAGGTLTLEPVWLMLSGRPAYDESAYADAVAAQVPPLDPTRPRPFGWSTWSYYFSNIDASTVIENCAKVKTTYPNVANLVCQIDSGYETLTGDWTSYTSGFPAGLAPVAQAISAIDMTPGVWMAPLLVDSRSKLVTENPDWFLYDAQKNPVIFWDPLSLSSVQYYVLDITVPAAAAHLTSVVAQRATEGFAYFKFDFLFVGAYEAVHADGSTAMQAFHKAMAVLRAAAGANSYIVGCGAPWLPVVGEVHAVRGSPDVVSSFPGVPVFTTMANLGRFHGARAFADGVWFAYDPDNLVIRPPLSDAQAEVEMAMVWMSGSTLLGDSLLELTQERLGLLLAPESESLRTSAKGRFWAPDLLSEAVPYPIPTLVDDLLGLANAPPLVWVREQGNARLVAIFAWSLTPTSFNFQDRDLAISFPNGGTIVQVFGAAGATLVRQANDSWLANVPAQSAAVFLITPNS
jgi:hypothetical protein